MGDICIPNMKFLCLTLWQGEVCTNDVNDDDDARRIKHDCVGFWLINQVRQKSMLYLLSVALSALGVSVVVMVARFLSPPSATTYFSSKSNQ